MPANKPLSSEDLGLMLSRKRLGAAQTLAEPAGDGYRLDALESVILALCVDLRQGDTEGDDHILNRTGTRFAGFEANHILDRRHSRLADCAGRLESLITLPTNLTLKPTAAILRKNTAGDGEVAIYVTIMPQEEG